MDWFENQLNPVLKISSKNKSQIKIQNRSMGFSIQINQMESVPACAIMLKCSQHSVSEIENRDDECTDVRGHTVIVKRFRKRCTVKGGEIQLRKDLREYNY